MILFNYENLINKEGGGVKKIMIDFNNHLFTNNNNDDIFKKIDYKIIIFLDKSYKHFQSKVIQFKLNSKLVDKIIIEYNKNKYEYNNIPFDGILFNFTLDINNNIKILPFFKKECGVINIWDIEYIDFKNYVQIKWNKVLIINLERRPDRKKNITQKIIKNNINQYEIINAVDGRDVNIQNEYTYLFKNKNTHIVNSGHYACLLSHINTIKYAKKNNFNSIMILEDDVIFDDNFMELINKIDVPDFDILYIGGITNELKFFPDGWGKCDEIMGAYAYIIKSHMYDIILNLVSDKKYCIDIAFNEYIIKKYKVYILNDLIKTNLDSSDTSDKNNILIKLLNYTWIKPSKLC